MEQCRVCRKHDRDRKFIKVFRNNGEIALKLHQVCEIVIDESGDSNPGAVICENCLRNLKNALAFKIKALKSDRYFKHLCKVYPTPLLVEMVTCEIKQEPLELDAVEKSNPPIFEMNPNIDFIVSHNDSDSNDFDNNDAYFGDPMDTEETEERDRQKETEKLIEPDEAKDRIRKTSRYKSEPSKDIEPIKAGDETHYNRVPDGFSCASCNKTYKALHSFRSHFRFVHQKADQTMCQKCGKICASEGHLRLHMKTCGRSIKYECDVCGKVFINRSRIILHLKMVHFSTPCICHHCGKSFGNERYLAIHSQIHDYKEKNIKPFACKFCEKRFHSYQGWKLHERNSHRGGAAAPLPEMFLDDNEDGKSSMVNCKRCPSSFNTKRELTEHIAIDHPEVMPVGETCQICNKTFTSSYCLSQHIRRVHDKASDFQCHICKIELATRQSLRNHLNLHFKLIVFSCDVEGCGKVYTTNYGLTYHKEKFHSNINLDKNLRCPYCARRFHLPELLKKHMKTHVEKGKYSCKEPNCSSSFFHISHLHRHIRNVHKHSTETRKRFRMDDPKNLDFSQQENSAS